MLRVSGCRKHGVRWGGMLAAVAVGAWLAGCTSIERSEAEQNEQLLSASGFNVRPADTPQKLQGLQAMHQRKLIRKDNGGTLQYVYADAEFCRCLYVGNEANYQRYQALVVQEQIAVENRMAAENFGIDNQWAYDPWAL